MSQHIFTSQPNKHGKTLVLDTATMIGTIEDPRESPSEWTRIKLVSYKEADWTEPDTKDIREEIEGFIPSSYIESMEYAEYFNEEILCMVNTTDDNKVMAFYYYELENKHTRSNPHRFAPEEPGEAHDLPDDDETDLIHHFQRTLRALHKRIHALHARVQHHEHIKVAISEKHAGFRVSREGIRLYEQLSGQPFPDHQFISAYQSQFRTDPYLIRVIETLKDRASASGTELVIKQIPSDIDWHIHEYDGYESIYKTVDDTDYELRYDGSWRDTSEDDPNDEL
jgi:hypothetical protein